jgi:hypothetical protein
MLRPTDIGAMLEAFGLDLEEKQKQRYYAPWRQVFNDIIWVEKARKYGYEIMLVGEDLLRLAYVLKNPRICNITLSQFNLAVVIGSSRATAHITDMFDHSRVYEYIEPDNVLQEPAKSVILKSYQSKTSRYPRQ